MHNLYEADVNYDLDDRLDYQMFHNVTVGNRTPEFHSHDYYELYFFCEGSASIYIEEYAFRLNPGDMVLFPPERMHRALFHDSAARYERMLLYIRRDALREIGMPDCDLLAAMDGIAQRAQFHRSLDEEKQAFVRQMFREAAGHGIVEAPYERVLTRSRVAMLVTSACKWLAEAPAEGSARAEHRMAGIIAYLNEHISEDLSLDAISARFFISKYHLLREFKNYTNRTVYQYIISKRVMLAKQRMRMGVSPTGAYQACGFQDYSSFYKAFRKETGLSPKQFASGRN